MSLEIAVEERMKGYESVAVSTRKKETERDREKGGLTRQKGGKER